MYIRYWTLIMTIGWCHLFVNTPPQWMSRIQNAAAMPQTSTLVTQTFHHGVKSYIIASAVKRRWNRYPLSLVNLSWNRMHVYTTKLLWIRKHQSKRIKGSLKSPVVILLHFRRQAGWSNVYLKTETPPFDTSLAYANIATQVEHNNKHLTLNNSFRTSTCRPPTRDSAWGCFDILVPLT